MMVARGWRERAMGSYCLMGIQFQFCEKYSGDWLHNNVNALNAIDVLNVLNATDVLNATECT